MGATDTVPRDEITGTRNDPATITFSLSSNKLEGSENVSDLRPHPLWHPLTPKLTRTGVKAVGMISGGPFRARYGMKTKGNEKSMFFAARAFGVQKHYSATHQQSLRREDMPVGPTEARGPHAKRVIPPDSGTPRSLGGSPGGPRKGYAGDKPQGDQPEKAN